mgnify:CR=1 FL=1
MTTPSIPTSIKPLLERLIAVILALAAIVPAPLSFETVAASSESTNSNCSPTRKGNLLTASGPVRLF